MNCQTAFGMFASVFVVGAIGADPGALPSFFDGARGQSTQLHKKTSNHKHGRRMGLRSLENIIAKGLSDNDADAFAALDAVARIIQPSLMDSINQMRCEVCWKREDVLAHKKCVNFFAKSCKKWYNGGKKNGKVCPNVCADLLDLCVKASRDEDNANQEEGRELYKRITGENPPPPEGAEKAEEDEEDREEMKEKAEKKDAEDGSQEQVSPDADALAPTPAPAARKESTAPGDRDGDASIDMADAFPDDPSEDKDSDGDGFGDKRDPWPLNPNCYHPGEPCEDEKLALEPTIPMTQVVDPMKLNKVRRDLPSQGYDEHSHKLVRHKDWTTQTSDWGQEWPEFNTESEAQSVDRICKDYPESKWCIMQVKKRQLRRSK